MESGLRQYRSGADLSQCGTVSGGCYQSRWFRGLETGMEWLRLTVEGSGAIRVRVYVSEEEPEKFSGPGDRLPVLDRQDRDLLLYGVRGRFLCFTAEPETALDSFCLEFPGHSIDEGLPAVLQQDETLRALLGVYQSRFMDLNRHAAGFPDRLDPQSPEALEQLERWLGAVRWTADTDLRRKILPKARQLSRLRGTRRGLVLLSQLVTGCPCRIVEAWALQQEWKYGPRYQEELRFYGSSGSDVTILLPQQVPRSQAEQFRSLLPDFMPLGIRWNLVHLSDELPMDGHSYLDENAVLRGSPVCEMDAEAPEEWVLE